MASRPRHLDELTPVSWALLPLSLLYSAGWCAYFGTYRVGLKRPVRAHPRVVCVGNLLVGGTGKTPFVVYVAGLLLRLGATVVIGASGYGAARAAAATVAPPGPLDPAEWGDEPALLRTYLPNLPLVVGRRRVLAATLALEHFPDSVLLMDDGFQHLPLEKDLTILLDPESANRLPLPAGPYREPRSFRSRANVVYPRDGEILRSFTLHDTLGNPLRHASQTVNVACAVARPQRLICDIEAMGFIVNSSLFFRDHDPLNDPELFTSLDAKIPVVVTRKDEIKLRGNPGLQGRVLWIADYDVCLSEVAESALMARLCTVVNKQS